VLEASATTALRSRRRPVLAADRRWAWQPPEPAFRWPSPPRSSEYRRHGNGSARSQTGVPRADPAAE
jgi:hypothetical protein